MTTNKIPPKITLVDQQQINVVGPDGFISAFQYDKETGTLYAKEEQVVIPAFHGVTHISSDPIPNATTDTSGLESADDKAKLDALTQMRIGVLGFAGAGFPDDGGFMQGDIIFAPGSEFLSIERIGNVIRFTVDLPNQFCGCETCAQIYWVQDESDVSAIRPPSCSGKLPGVNSYNEMKVYLLPESTILDPASPTKTLNKKTQYPAMIFKRYDNAVTPGSGQYELVLQRNGNGTSQVGWSMTPGSTGIPECVWFMGLDDDGGQIRFDLGPELQPDLLGALLYKGHTLTRQMAVVTGYTQDVLSTNVYNCKMWSVNEEKPVGDEFTARNVWRYQNPENSATATTDPRSLVTDATKDVLPVGTLVQIWEFQIGEGAQGERIVRRYFNTDPGLSPDHLWTLSGVIRFGDEQTARTEVNLGTTGERTSCEERVNNARIIERSQWGITTFEDPLLLTDDGLGTDPLEANLGSFNVGFLEAESDLYQKPNTTINLSDSSTNPSSGLISLNNYSHKFIKFVDGALAGQSFEILHNSDNAITIFGDLPGVLPEDSFVIFGEAATMQPSGIAYNNQFVANDDPTIPGLKVTQTDPLSDCERPVFVWHRQDHKDMFVTALIGQPDDTNFPPIDILLRAPVDAMDDSYVKVIKRGQFTGGPYSGKYYVVTHGLHWKDLPQRGVLRTMTGLTRNEIWRFNVKMAFPPMDDDGVVLVSEDNTPYLFDDDFGIGTGASGSDNTPPTLTIPTVSSIAQVLKNDFSAPAVRLQFSIIDQTNAESVQLQVRAGLLDMCTAYELDSSTARKDDLVRGFRAGEFTVSKIHTQQGFIDSIETPSSEPENFKVYRGGFLPIPVDGETERFNVLQLMYRGSQLWIWWNGLLITPDPTLSAALPTPVAVSTPYFPVEPLSPSGKLAFRLWPGAVVREIEVRDKLVLFNEFTNGQLRLGT